MLANISYLSLGSVTVAINEATSIYSASLYGCYCGYGTPKFLYLSYSFYINSLLNSSGILAKNSASKPNSCANYAYSG